MPVDRLLFSGFGTNKAVLAAMSLASAIRRQVADPSLGVSDLMKVVRSEMATCQSWDLWKLLEHPGGRSVPWSWKTAPVPAWMEKTASFMERFVALAPNGVLQGAKLRQAILKLGHERKINYTRWNEDDFSDKCDLVIRVLLSHFRLLKQKKEDYQRCMRKATEAEQLAIDQVLGKMNLECGEHVYGASQAASSAPAAIKAPPSPPKPADHQIVPFGGQQAFSLSGDDSLVFKRILAKTDSNEEKSTALVLAAAGTSSSSWEGRRPSTTSSGTVLDKMNKEKKRTSGGMRILPEEDDPLVGFSPMVEKKVKKPVQKPKKEKKEEGDLLVTPVKKKPPAASELGLSDDDLENIESALETGKVQKSVKEKKKSPKKATAKKKAQKKVSKKEKKEKKKCTSPKAQERKSTFRHRKTSAAYHKENGKYKRLGYSPGTCKKMARAAWLKVAQEIDSGVLKEEHVK